MHYTGQRGRRFLPNFETKWHMIYFQYVQNTTIGSSTSSVVGFGFGLADFSSLSQVIALKAHRAGTCKPCAYFFAKADGCRLHNSCEFCRSLSGFLCRLRRHCSECIQTSWSYSKLLTSRGGRHGTDMCRLGWTDGWILFLKLRRVHPEWKMPAIFPQTWMPRPFMSSRRN